MAKYDPFILQMQIHLERRRWSGLLQSRAGHFSSIGHIHLVADSAVRSGSTLKPPEHRQRRQICSITIRSRKEERRLLKRLSRGIYHIGTRLGLRQMSHCHPSLHLPEAFNPCTWALLAVAVGGAYWLSHHRSVATANHLSRWD
ncbi:hypothetical protein, variant [Exophiala dermatitidis NIH/UT8656]|uniref:Uncharacterized protein n=1 Tax=Exophiala dermatitidis (strain ATCC 34100 / CBS 525.76 / NIH/UT8656) TaxID=858893 RepID=H6BRA3_EXODN|nr:uncharacterized protein HMPREF1120_02851 [Exophiala dermatitidis NIH/UT8656]XP_009155146.1 hypothetical protein, variant [Exophiala dermatitidis NIH/UT8656]EHY54684.1 hypothetical protein, variant [Exophiala dermatitidis NIH/UT8656]EHY54685.1 hypothetical protein HMPREF1120_02851 [Exophiala dermatitidis NIH/UT8656]